jgi:hypothetical protein
MVTDQEYVDFARDCVRLAQSADSPELRERLLQIAREWMAVAMPKIKRQSQNRRSQREIPSAMTALIAVACTVLFAFIVWLMLPEFDIGR